jgi:hypothetical protein
MFRQSDDLTGPQNPVCTGNTGVDIDISIVGVNNYQVVVHIAIFIAGNQTNLTK